MLDIVRLPQFPLVWMRINHPHCHQEITGGSRQVSTILPYIPDQSHSLFLERGHLLDMTDIPVNPEGDGMTIIMPSSFANSQDVSRNSSTCPSLWFTKQQKHPSKSHSLSSSSMRRLWKPPPPVDPPLHQNISSLHVACQQGSSPRHQAVLLVFLHCLHQNTCHLHPAHKFHQKVRVHLGQSTIQNPSLTILQSLRRDQG